MHIREQEVKLHTRVNVGRPFLGWPLFFRRNFSCSTSDSYPYRTSTVRGVVCVGCFLHVCCPLIAGLRNWPRVGKRNYSARCFTGEICSGETVGFIGHCLHANIIRHRALAQVGPENRQSTVAVRKWDVDQLIQVSWRKKNRKQNERYKHNKHMSLTRRSTVKWIDHSDLYPLNLVFLVHQ